MYNTSIIGKNIKLYREKAGYSQKELAKLVGIANSTMSQYENGDRLPSDEIKYKISSILNVTLNDLFGVSDKKVIRIPVLGKVIAGIPIEAVTDIVDYEEISSERARNGEYFALKITGNSMAPRISNGDVVIVRKQNTVDNRDVAIVLVNGCEATIKEVQKNDFGITLVGWNLAEYTPKFYSLSEIESLPVRILGKVVEVRVKL
ncbi:MAG: helix-turn-helix domain-containing protein [Phascolarctobacterium sp.]|nr:helix-turn-helix domain-containing protein [Phascolarctobacterium sp.]MBR6636909.1 helix-turn-helix domain-containing protein [Phascolarctobacterium sp.]